jgi:hypothetical protein
MVAIKATQTNGMEAGRGDLLDPLGDLGVAGLKVLSQIAGPALSLWPFPFKVIG